MQDPPELPEVTADDQEPLALRAPMDIIDEADNFDDDDYPDTPDPEVPVARPPGRKRGRKRGKYVPSDDTRPRGTALSPGRRISSEELAQRVDNIDLWMDGFAWDQSGMYCTIKRIAPNYVQGIPVGGELSSKKNSGFSYEEIVGRWGGGEFKICVFGPRSETDSHPVPLNQKTFMIPGQPLLDEDALPEGTRDKMAQQGSIYQRGPRPPDPATRALDHAYAEVESMRARPDPSDKIAEMSQRMVETVSTAASEKAAAAISAADERAKLSIEMASQERAERAKLDDRMRDMEKESRENESRLRVTLAQEIKSAQDGSMALLTSLLPQMSNASSDNVKMIVAQYSAKESQLMAAHQNDINNLNQMHQAQMQSVQNNNESQLRHLESLHKNHCTLYEAQIIALRAENEALKRQLEDARRDADKARNDLTTRILSQKESDPLDQVAKVGSLVEMVRGLSGLGGDKEEGAGSGLDDNPMMKNMFQLADKALPVIGDFLAQRKAGAGGAPALPPAGYVQAPQSQVYAQVPPGYQLVPIQRPVAQRPAAQRPAVPPPPPPEPKLSREDVQAAIDFVNGLLSQPEPAAPEETASGAISLLPNDVLKQLCRRTPEKLIAALKAEGMLIGPCATEQGQAYLTKLLHALKQKFLERGDSVVPVKD